MMAMPGAPVPPVWPAADAPLIAPPPPAPTVVAADPTLVDTPRPKPPPPPSGDAPPVPEKKLAAVKDAAGAPGCESPRVLRRHYFLREYCHEKIKYLFPRSP